MKGSQLTHLVHRTKPSVEREWIQKGVAVIQVILGVMCVTVGCVALNFRIGMGYSGHGIIGGCFFILTGCIGTTVIPGGSKGRMTAYMVTSKLSVALFVPAIILVSIIGISMDISKYQSYGHTTMGQASFINALLIFLASIDMVCAVKAARLCPGCGNTPPSVSHSGAYPQSTTDGGEWPWKGLAITQTILGICCVIIMVIALAYQIGMSYLGHGLWGGVFFIITGCIGISVQNENSQNKITAYMILSILSAAVFVPFTICASAAGIPIDNKRWQAWDPTIPSRNNSLNSMLICFAGIELVVAIVAAVLCCVCRSPNLHDTAKAPIDKQVYQVHQGDMIKAAQLQIINNVPVSYFGHNQVALQSVSTGYLTNGSLPILGNPY